MLNRLVQEGTTACAACPLNGKPHFRSLSEEELAVVHDLKQGEVRARARAMLISEGTPGTRAYTMLRGWAFQFKSLPDGRRQIINFVLPGDFIGLQSMFIGENRFSLETLSDATLCVFDTKDLVTLLRQGSSLSVRLLEVAAEQEMRLEEQLLSIGQRTGLERLAFSLIQLFKRCDELGLTYGGSLFLPFRQQHLADMLGLSLVHTNKMLRKLNDAGLIRLKSRRLEILNAEELARLGRFDLRDKHRHSFL